MKRATRGAALSSLLLIAAVAACGGDSEASFEPTLEWGACPGDVEVTFLSRHECGTLTVLEDRDEPDGRTVELLVVKAWPVGVEPGPGIAHRAGRQHRRPIPADRRHGHRCDPSRQRSG